MFEFNKMKIKSKILLGYIVMAVFCLAMGVILYVKVGVSNNIGIVAIIIAVAAIIFGLFYGSHVSNTILLSVDKTKKTVEELCKGHLSVRTKIDTVDEIGELGESLNTFIQLLQDDLIGALECIAAGDLSHEFESKDSKDDIAVILQKISYTIRRINDGMGRLIHDVTDGNLETRGDKTLFTGIWSEFIGNINGLIEAFVAPINQTSDYVDRISKGDIPPRITAVYKGDFNIIKTNLNNCIDIMNGLLKESDTLILAAKNGELTARGKADNFTGGWKQLIDDINLLLETMVKPVMEVSNTMQEMSQGNLEVKVKGTYGGDFGELVNAVNTTISKLHDVVQEISETLISISEGNIDIEEVQMYTGNFENISISMNKIVDSLNSTLGEIHMAADQVSVGAAQVADGSQLLAQGATEQASTVEELTEAVTQVAAQTKENASNANHANTLVIKIKDSAQQGNHQMGEMLGAMEEINEASANISKVIKVIDDMAFQTNILALNAAVEAARAGQHGKGFAVVAEEVRNLAAQSANAAKETTALIEGSISRAKRGEEIANETAKALQEIVDGVTEAANLISGIAVSSNEQASGISQINTGISQVSEVVQTNSATSQQSAASSEELSGQSELLKELVNHFRLKGSNGNIGKNRYRDNYSARRYDGRDYQRTSGKPQIILSDSEFGKY